MSQRFTHVATLHLPLPARQAAAVLVGIESQFPNAQLRPAENYNTDRVEVWAPTTAALQILDGADLLASDLDLDDVSNGAA